MKSITKITTLSLLLFVLLAYSCVKEKITPRDYPRVHTLEVTNINESGATFNADIFYNEGHTIVDHGFIWNIVKSTSMSGSNMISLGSFKEKGEFSFDATYGIDPDITTFVRAFIITEEFTYLGEPIAFIGKGCDPPVISSYEPLSAAYLDTITIYGSNFSNRLTGNLVYFGGNVASVIEVSEGLIKALVPMTLAQSSSTISVVSSGNTVNISPSFTLLMPEFFDFFPKTAPISDTVTITGANLSPLYTIWIYFGNFQASRVSTTDSELKVKVPFNIDAASVPVRIVAFSTEKVFDDEFQVDAPVIKSFTPTSGTSNSSVTISGYGFQASLANNQVTVGGITVSPNSVWATNISFRMPAGLATGDYKISVTTMGLTTESEETFHYTAPGK